MKFHYDTETQESFFKKVVNTIRLLRGQNPRGHSAQKGLPPFIGRLHKTFSFQINQFQVLKIFSAHFKNIIFKSTK